MDWGNPVLNYFKHDANHQEFAENDVMFTFEVGTTSYNDVLKRLYCSDAIILGFSSMNVIITTTNPTAKQIYYPKPFINSWFLPQKYSSRTLNDGRDNFVYVIQESSLYSPYVEWHNTPDQNEEMMNFRDGKLVKVGTNHLLEGVIVG